ncbi:MAG TPA: cysteine desulfurase [Candidatus Diapherotrites archaeon]|uniref:Cysteine desulfurase n=1 Tax=Candidatus Iainarchaeum sp. TaxID=3101447 RepID=A0A7J4J282_9ARCH|nr:cysteine desulfurase [Candidatus Diapherotrites archaeon]
MDVQKIRADFPILQKRKDVIYLDNAATSLKPKPVLEAMDSYYSNMTANIGRGSHRMSQEASRTFEDSRREVAKFIGAHDNELIFTRNATEGINTAAFSLDRMGHFSEGDEIVVSIMEHHANFIPWQQLCLAKGLRFKIVALNDDYTLNMDDLASKVSKRTKMVAICHGANTVGTITPAKEIGQIAHDSGALFLLDGAQSVPHMPLDVKKINCDFLAFSAHKMLGPTGIGALYGKAELLAKMPPYNYGGGMIQSVGADRTTFAGPPQRFEAGTMPIAEAFGFAQSVRYLKRIGMQDVAEHEKKLTERCIRKLGEIGGIELYCPKNADKQGGIVLFEAKGIDAVDFALALDESRGIAIRSGLHCAEPMVSSINPKGLDRASFYVYNTAEEVDILCEQASKIARAFA